ncbi:15.4 kDa class V heat shock protein [Linum perenne]
MDYSPYHSSPWQYLIATTTADGHPNYVHWNQNPDSHVFSADIPGTEAVDGSNNPPERSFMRKFRLPDLVDVDGISAAYEDGVLKVTVPRASRRRGVVIDPADLPERMDRLAPAA